MRILLAALFATNMLNGLAAAETMNFDGAKAGARPPGWTATQTGDGKARWTIDEDDAAPSKPNVLKQSGRATFPVALLRSTNLKDGFVAVQFKTIAGMDDQAGGVVWRAQDADNYYVARANAREDNVCIYRVVHGKRKELQCADRKVAPGKWHDLRVEFAGNRFKVLFNGKSTVEAADDTFKDAGKVGVWTKSDSVTVFDDFSYGDH